MLLSNPHLLPPLKHRTPFKTCYRPESPITLLASSRIREFGVVLLWRLGALDGSGGIGEEKEGTIIDCEIISVYVYCNDEVRLLRR